MGLCFSQNLERGEHRVGGARANPVGLRRFFYAWRIEAINTRSQRDYARYSTTLAELHQRIADNEETVTNAVRISYAHPDTVDNRDRPENSAMNGSYVCVVCLNDIGGEKCVECACAHRVCFACADRICRTAFDEGATNEIPCPSPTECKAQLNYIDLYQMEGGRIVARETQHRSSIKIALDLLAEYPDVDEATLRMQYIRHDKTYAAYQCPQCSFGPIEHMHCNDLTEWHARENHSNNCPRCGHLTPTSDQLLPWSGGRSSSASS